MFMCSLIGISHKGSFALGMNRDDDYDRVHKGLHSKNVFFPIDSRAGGTWIGVHPEGMVFALLNGRGKQEGDVSRGTIIPQLLQKISFESLDLSCYAAFQLLCASVHEESFTIHTWDGEILNTTVYNNKVILASSGYGHTEKKICRLEELDLLSKEDLYQALISHEPEKGVGSICMHGKKGGTLSTSLVLFAKDTLEVWMTQGPPCENALTQVYTQKVQ